MSFYRGPQGTSVTLSFPPVTPGVKLLLWILGVAFGIQFLLQTVLGLGRVVGWFVLWPPALLAPPYPAWTLLTYGLLHGGLWHLLLNMLGIWMFGGDVERMLGTTRFWRFFVYCVLGGGLLYALVGLLRGGGAPVVGASAGVLGIAAAFAVFFPTRKLFVFPIPFPLSAKVVVIGYAVITLLGSVSASPRDPIAHLAHLGGLIVGFVYAWTFRRGIHRGFGRALGGGEGGWGQEGGRRPPFRVVRGERDDDRYLH